MYEVIAALCACQNQLLSGVLTQVAQRGRFDDRRRALILVWAASYPGIPFDSILGHNGLSEYFDWIDTLKATMNGAAFQEPLTGPVYIGYSGFTSVCYGTVLNRIFGKVFTASPNA